MLATLPVSEGRPLRGAKESTEASRAVPTLWSAQAAYPDGVFHPVFAP